MMKPGATGVEYVLCMPPISTSPKAGMQIIDETIISLGDFALYLAVQGPRKTERTSKRVRVIFNRTVIVDTTEALYVWEHDAYPQFYVASRDLRDCALTEKHPVRNEGGLLVAHVVELSVRTRDEGELAITDRVVRFIDDSSLLGSLAGMVRLEFASMDQWLEEDVPIFVHPKDPYKRIDILQSLRTVEVRVHGKTVARSPSSMHLFETGLPTRFYLPLASVDQAVLRRSDLITKCPYKGDAEYYHVVVDGKEARDVVWYYRLPTPESASIAGLLCFYNEKVDIVLDGQLLERPKTAFS